jgi:xylan 1,4-beta-xylosidase
MKASLLHAAGLLALLAVFPASPQAQTQTLVFDTIHVDAQAATTPFPHFWEQTFGSGRAILSQCEASYQLRFGAVPRHPDGSGGAVRS